MRIFWFKQKTAYELRISDWSSDVCSSDLVAALDRRAHRAHRGGGGEHIMPFEQPGDAAFSHRERRQHQRAVRDALDPGDRDPAFQRNGSGKDARRGGLIGHGVRLLTAALQSGKAHADLTDSYSGAVAFPIFLDRKSTRLNSSH